MAYELLTLRDQERLFSKIDIRGDDECWEWQAKANNGLGYGRFGVGPRGKQKLYYPHRLMWELANKRSVPDGLEICHDCDNPKCCNPSHLFVDTHSANLLQFHDRNPGHFQRRKGTKLTREDAQEIRRLYATGKYSYYSLGDKYGVNHSTIGLIMQNKTHRIQDDTAATGGARMSAKDVMEGLN